MRSSRGKTNHSARLARAAIIGAGCALAAVIALHLLNPEYDLVARPLSDYAVGRGGWLIATAIFAFAISALAIARGLSTTRASRAGVVSLYIAGIAYLIASIFPTDARLDNTVVTLAGALHFVAGYLSSPALVIAAILLARDSRALAFALWASLVILVSVNILEWHIGGIGQRIFFAMALAWIIQTARRLAFDSNIA
jgi:hypothetical protein